MTSATAKPKVPTRKSIRHNLAAPPVIQAAQIALVLMGAAKTSNWAGVVSETNLAERVLLTDDQQRLLEEHRGILPYLTRGGREGTLRSVIACPDCNRVMFTGTGIAPPRCQITLGCEGKPVKARSTQEPEPREDPTTKTLTT